MFPAQQCLEADQFAGGDAVQRLEVQVQLAFGQCATQADFHESALAGLFVHRRLEEAIAAPPFGLGAIERKIGVFNQRLAITPIGRTDGDADAGATFHRLAADRQWCFETGRNLTCESGNIGGGRHATHHDDELIAAEPSDDGVTQSLCQPGGDRFEYRIANRMPLSVVDQLEIVEIAIADQHLFARVAAAHGEVELFVEQFAVGQAGQDIVQRHMADALLALGNRPDHGVEAAGEAPDFVVAVNLHHHRLALSEAPGSAIEAGNRADDAARYHQAGKNGDGNAAERQADEDHLQHCIARQRGIE